MSAFDGLTCKCGHVITDHDRQWDWPSDEGYPRLADDGFWEYVYLCPDCHKWYWRPRIGDDYPEGGGI